MTIHNIITANSNHMPLDNCSVNLIVTSPPYPMISLWDNLFEQLCPEIVADRVANDGRAVYSKMHSVLDAVWRECDRVLKPGGIICINIGDATRTINKHFAVYSNHSCIIEFFESMCYTTLPLIIWQKVSNSPTKFMGSGMLPTEAYVTQEHEYILIFRKGDSRQYNTVIEKNLRHESGYFYEERNVWFSDVWRIKGERQKNVIKDLRSCKASYPLEIPYRLINMFSIKGDVVLDPFNGTGTTMLASMLCERNSVGIEIEPKFAEYVKQRSLLEKDVLNERVYKRYKQHMTASRIKNYGMESDVHNFKVKTVQEKGIRLCEIQDINWRMNTALVKYSKIGEVG